MASGNPPQGGGRAVVPLGAVVEAVGQVTGPLTVPRRLLPRVLTPPGEPTLPQEDDPTGPMVPSPQVEDEPPLPNEVVPLLQQLVMEVMGLRALTLVQQEDMRVLRQVLAGPFRFLTFAPLSVNLTVPLSVAASTVQPLVTQQSFPGSVLWVAVMTDDRNFRIRPVFDGTANAIDVDQLVTFNINQPVAPTGVSIQADPANSRFTTVLNPGAPEGMTFFKNFALDVENLDSSAHNILDFLVIMRQYVPLNIFPGLVQLES